MSALTQQVLGYCGLASATLLFLAPVPTCRRVLAARSAEGFDVTPYATSLAQCALWVVYALPAVTPDRTEPLLTNAIGASLELCYCAVFLCCAGSAARLREVGAVMAGALAVAGALVAACLLSFHSRQERSQAMGVACMGINILMYAAPLNAFREAIRTRSVEYVPLGLSVATIANAGVWLAYGLAVMDINILIPNACGVALGATQLLLYAWLQGSASEDTAPVGDERLLEDDSSADEAEASQKEGTQLGASDVAEDTGELIRGPNRPFRGIGDFAA